MVGAGIARPALGLDLEAFRPELSWSGFGEAPGIGAFQVGDVDGDGREEILVAANVSLYPFPPSQSYWYVLSVDQRIRQTWSSFSYEDGLRRVELVDGPSGPLVVAATAHQIYVYDGANRELLSSFPVPAQDVRAISSADFDGLGGLELAACDENDLFVFDLQTGTLTRTLPGFGCTSIEAGQVDSDPALEIALGGNPSGIFLFDGSTWTLDWAEPSRQSRWVALRDSDGDGLDELLAAQLDDVGLWLFDTRQSLVLWERPLYPNAFAFADVDADGSDEILVSTLNSVLALEMSTGATSWNLDGWSAGAQAIAAGDFDRDGQLELVLSVAFFENRSDAIVSLDAATGAIEAKSESIGSSFHGLSIGDVHDDGRLEVVASYSGGFGVFPSNGGVLHYDLLGKTIEYVGDAPGGPNSSAGKSLLAEIDNDRQLEHCVIFRDSDETQVACRDGTTHSLEWQSLIEGGSLLSIASEDLVGDEEPEIVVGGSWGRAFVLDGASGALFFTTDLLANVETEFRVLRIGDVDGELGFELIAGGDTFNFHDHVLAVFDAHTGGLKYGPHPVPAAAFDLAQTDADPELELYAVTLGGDLVAVDPVSGATSAPIASFGAGVTALRVGDLTRDGAADFAVADSGSLRVYGGAEQSEIWSSGYLDPHAGERDTLWLADFDLDTVPELLVNTDIGFALFEAPLVRVFSDGFESGDTSQWSSTTP